MSLYPKQSLQMLVDLINAANPTLPVPLTTTNVLYGAPAAITPTGGNIQNTSIKLTAVAGSQYIGNQTLQYRRIDFGILFRSLPIVIYKYSPAGTGSVPYRISDLIPAINAKYGLNLTSADFTDGNLPVGNTLAVPAIGLAAGTRNSSVTVTAPSTSPGYINSFTLYWVQAPQDISTMITVTNLENARVYPGKLNTVSASPYVVDLDSYYYDWTATLNQIAANQATTLATVISFLTVYAIGNYVNGQNGYGTSVYQFIQALAALTGQPYTMNSPASASMSLYQAQFVHYTLPNAAVPEADSKYFNNCLVVTIPGANSWGAGKMIFHYNV